MMKKNIKNRTSFIISRSDNIGDVVLTLPMISLLKQNYPESKIILLARDYVKAIAEACHDIDQFLSWDKILKLSSGEAIELLKSTGADTIFHIYPRYKIARLAKQAKIKLRIGTANRWYHYFTCNRRVKFTRARSSLHEAQLNLKLLKPLGISKDFSLPEIIPLFHLSSPPPSEKIRRLIDPSRFNLILHPYSHGNGREWPPEKFKALIELLSNEDFHFLITGSKKEGEQFHRFLPTKFNITDTTGKLTLAELLELISLSDGLVASGTGPLHIAAAMGMRTLGIFCSKPTISPTRWGPLGKRAQYLVGEKREEDCQKGKSCLCMESITALDVKRVARSWLLEKKETK